MNVLLIDDHPLVLGVFRALAQELGGGVDVMTATTARQAHDTLAFSTELDVVLLDLQSGDKDGIALLVRLHSAYPALPIVVLAASDHREDMMRALDLGAKGYIPKYSANLMVMDALRRVTSGDIYLPPPVMRSPMQSCSSAPIEQHNGQGAPDGEWAGAAVDALALTKRQKEVLALLLRGQSNKLIARSLNLSVDTIKDHVAAVLRALKVSSRTQVVLAVSKMANPAVLPSWREQQTNAMRP